MTNKLPEPPTYLKKQSELLENQIHTLLGKQSSLTFADYMHHCLYMPGLGYYSSGLQKFGADGDFVTAPELTPLFTHCLAKRTALIFESLSQRNLLEVGAGSGKLAADFLDYCQNNNIQIDNYYILEVSADLKEMQKETIKTTIPEQLDKVIWLDALPHNFSGVVIANEFIDAMPVHLFEYTQDQFLEKHVKMDSANTQACTELDLVSRDLSFTNKDTLPQDAKNYLAQFQKNFSDGYTSEINLAITPWLHDLYQRSTQCVVLLIDYGFDKATYYHPDRQRGTLMCHYQHHAHDDVFFYPGLQDITAHVDFSFVAENALNIGFDVETYTTQADFLMAHGILDNLHQDAIAHYQQAQAIKRLLLPSEMGELFKVLVLSKDYPALIENFCLKDRRASL